MDKKVAAQGFLNALTDYLGGRLEKRKPSADQLEQRYGTYLRSIGFEPNTPLFNALMKHMEKMKDAGGVRKIRR